MIQPLTTARVSSIIIKILPHRSSIGLGMQLCDYMRTGKSQIILGQTWDLCLSLPPSQKGSRLRVYMPCNSDSVRNAGCRGCGNINLWNLNRMEYSIYSKCSLQMVKESHIGNTSLACDYLVLLVCYRATPPSYRANNMIPDQSTETMSLKLTSVDLPNLAGRYCPKRFSWWIWSRLSTTLTT